MVNILHKGIGTLLKMLQAGLQGNKRPVFHEFPSGNGMSKFQSVYNAQPDVVVLGPGVQNPVPLLQQVHAQDKALSVVVVAEPDNYQSIKQSVQFAPFIGSNVKVVENRAITLVVEEITEAIRRTQQRRKYLSFNFESKKIEPTLAVSGTVRQQYMDRFMDLAPVGAVLLDNELRIVTLNRQASVFFSMDKEAEGQRFTDLFTSDLREGIEEFLESDSINNGSLLKTVPLAKGDRKVFLDLLVSKDFRLDVPGYSIVILLDVTERIRWEEILSSKEERLRMAMEAGEMGAWDYDLVTGMLDWNKRGRELFGLGPEDKVDYDVFVRALHPDDREHVYHEMQKALEGVNNGVLDTQYRVVNLNDGSTRWIRAKGRAVFNEEGIAVRFIGIVLDVTEVVRSRDILEEAIANKNEFFSIASHELKTPLTSLKAYVQLVNEKLQQQSEPSTLNYVRKVIEQVDKLNLLVSELLDLSKLEAGKLSFNMQEFDFDQMVEDAISVLQPSLKTHRIIKKGKAGTPVTGDKQRLEQVLMNYLTNAVKYSPGKEKILVDIKNDGRELTVAVTDEGIGIPEAKLPRIFERFYRVEGIVHRFQGFGIGLYIASEIIKRHKGRVWLESREGKGSTFYFSIPVK